MYVAYEEFIAQTVSAEPPSRELYARLSPVADSVIDSWTLGRVGRAVDAEEELPPAVVTLYCAIVESLPAALSGGSGTGELVKSFSNGVDKFEFEDGGNAMDRLMRSCHWMLGLLPIEWCSACVSFEGGNGYAG